MPRDPAKRKAAYARYRSKPEVKARRLAYNRAWRTSRRDHVRGYDANYRRVHAETRRAYDTQYRADPAHKEKMRAYLAIYLPAYRATIRTKPRRSYTAGRTRKPRYVGPVLHWQPCEPRPFIREYHGPPDLLDDSGDSRSGSDTPINQARNLITKE